MKNVKIKKSEYCNKFFWCMLIITGIVMLIFYEVMIEVGDNEHHLALARYFFSKIPEDVFYPPQAVTYPVYHILVRIVGLIIGGKYNIAGILVLTTGNIAAILVTRFIMNKIVSTECVWKRYIIDVVSMGSIFFETLKGPLTNGRFYAEQCAANPWHNPTITVVRPIGLLVFYIFVCLLIKIKNREECKKELIAFSISSLICVLAKPSYVMVLIPAAGVLTFVFWSRDFKRHFRVAMLVLLSVIPTIVAIVIQFIYNQFFNKGIESPVGIALGSFSGFSFWEVVCVSIATFPIPIVVMLICRKKALFKNEYMQLSLLTLLIGWIQMFTLTNGASGDFSWGYDLSVGLSTIVSIAYVLKNYCRKWQMYIVLILYILQVIFGLQYFAIIYCNGGNFWI